MNKRIEDHVNALFANTGNESHILDIKEELLSNLNENIMTLSHPARMTRHMLLSSLE